MGGDDTPDPKNEPTKPDDLNVDRRHDMPLRPVDDDASRAVGDILDGRPESISPGDRSLIKDWATKRNRRAAARTDAKAKAGKRLQPLQPRCGR